MTGSSNSGLSADTQALMAFEAGKKSAGLAYLLWFFLGAFGGHRFYLGRSGSAVGQIVLNVLTWLTIWFGLGFVFLAALGIWLLIDLFLIPGIVSEHNGTLMVRLNRSASKPSMSSVDELAKFAALKEQGAITPEEFEAQKQRLIGQTKIDTPIVASDI